VARPAIIDSARTAFENLNERERRLVVILGVVLTALVVFLPLWLLTSSIGDVREENEEIRQVLREISQASGSLAVREAERAAAERLYDSPAPPLGSFLEAKAREAGYDRPLEVTDQPEKVSGGFTRRNVRASLPGVGLRTAIDMLTAIANSPHPVAIERLHIEHYQSGDRFNVQLGVIAFDRNQPRRAAEPAGAATPQKRTGGRPGPPAPP
jgi:hypothetical protein